MALFADIDNLNVHYSLEGSADHGLQLVLINSLGTDLRIWDAMIPHLDFKPAILRYDKRGHGLTDAPQGPYTIRNHSADLAGLLDTLEISGILLVGISVGGMIALDLASTHPNLIQALILCDTGAKIGTAAYWDDRIKAVQEKGLEPLADLILDRWFSPSFATNNPAAYRGYKKMLARTPPEGYIGTCAALRDADLRDLAKKVAAKTLILTGSEDLSTPLSMSKELHELLPVSDRAVIEGAGHLTCIERPVLVARRINQFVHDSLQK